MEERIPALGSCTIDLTENCNLACDYCFTLREANYADRVMKPEVAYKVIDWWFDQGDPNQFWHRNIAWWGGEPLLEYELLQKYTLYAEEAARKRGYRIDFGGTTNGTLYTPDKLSWLLEHQCRFMISLDGIEPAHDFHRKTVNGGGSWKIIDQNTREAIKMFPQQKVRFSFSVDTVKYFFENIQYFYDMGIRDVAFAPVYEGNWTEEEVGIFREQSELTFKFILESYKAKDPMILKHFNDEAALRNSANLGLPVNPCGAGASYGAWSYDGFYYPCHRFNKYTQTTEDRMRHEVPIIGSIYRGFVNDEFRRSFWGFKDDPPEKCRGCAIYQESVCRGGCYASNWDLTGDIRVAAPQVCLYAKTLHSVGQTFGRMADAEGIVIQQTSMDDRVRSCICYNMCYTEGSSVEIKHVDYGSGVQCICYNTQYGGPVDPPNTAPVDKQKERLKDYLAAFALKLYKEGKIPEP